MTACASTLQIEQGERFDARSNFRLASIYNKHFIAAATSMLVREG